MITGQEAPLTLASLILKASTIQAVRQSPSFNLTGWKILDRWAFNTPATLWALEATGELLLLERLLKQQELESKVLRESLVQQQEGMTEMEILQQNEVQTELV